MATKYLDFIGGNDANDGSSFALRKKTLSSATGVCAAGDTLRVMGYPRQNTGLTGTWGTNSPSVTLSAAVNKTIDTCETAWTAGAGMTTSTSAGTYKQGTKSATFVVGGGYVNGTISGLKDLGSTQDFSSYQVINLWIQSTVVFADSDWSLVLCSDAAGATPVNTLNLPAVNCINVWQAIVMDNGSALSSTVRSIYLKRNAGASTPTLTVDMLFASKAKTSADYIGLDTVVGKNANLGLSSSGVSPWYLVKWVDGTSLQIQAALNENAGNATPYTVAETVSLYTQRMILLASNTAGANHQTMAVSGTVTSSITVSGGWDTSAMSSQDGYSFLFCPNYTGYVVNATGRSYYTWSRVGMVGGAYQFYGSSAFHRHSFTDAVFMGGLEAFYPQTTTSNGHSFTTCYFSSGSAGNPGIFLGANLRFSNCIFDGMNGGFPGFGSNNTYVDSCDMIKCGYAAYFYGQPDGVVAIGAPNYFSRCTFSGSVTADVTARQGPQYFDNCLFGASSEVNTSTFLLLGDCVIYSTNHDQTAGNHQQWHEGGKIISDTSLRHTASGIAWKMSPTSTTRSSAYPLRTKIATVYCVSGTQTTVSAYFAKDHADISLGLRIRGGQLGGPSSDTTQTSSVGSGSAYEATATQIQWTPTSTGWVEIEAICYTASSTTANGWVDDFGCVYG